MTVTSFDTEALQIRQAEVVGVDDDGTVDAKIVPYEVEAPLSDGLWEVFSRGAFAAAVGNPSRCKVTNQGHDRAVVIGHAISLRDEEDGHYGKLRIADTSQGRDVLALLRAGSLSELSVEFRMQKRGYRFSPRPAGGQLLRHDKATLVGVSPVGAGAYGDAARVLAVRDSEAERVREQALARLHALTAGPKRA